MQKINRVLRDDQWEKLEPLLVGRPGDSGMCGRDNRLFMEAVLWVALKTGTWSNLAPEFGRWRTSYMRFRRWTKADVWRRVAESLADHHELQVILQAIIVLGDEHTRLNTERSIRRANVKTYGRALASASGAGAKPARGDELSSSWVWLVSDDVQTS
ncbi:transposase [Collimonas sp. PA-H2]|uniref:transposase n=1 Tax=Collimonas sp. PA-H2 TaxID=1881062 RepID=UPI000BFA655D|nr:transposase [Collimonas sp. PA-H2]PFH08407.1 transposase [Collimonas sp. PA-H2]